MEIPLNPIINSRTIYDPIFISNLEQTINILKGDIVTLEQSLLSLQMFIFDLISEMDEDTITRILLENKDVTHYLKLNDTVRNSIENIEKYEKL